MSHSWHLVYIITCVLSRGFFGPLGKKDQETGRGGDTEICRLEFVYNSAMDREHQEPPRPPLEPVDCEEAGCVSGVVLLVAVAVTVVMLFIWVLRKVW